MGSPLFVSCTHGGAKLRQYIEAPKVHSSSPAGMGSSAKVALYRRKECASGLSALRKLYSWGC
jgi:hypothetical protein